MKWAAAVSRTDNVNDAIREAAETIRGRLGQERADLVIAFVSEEYGPHLSAVPTALEELFGPVPTLFGCSTSGVIGEGTELSGQPAVSLIAASLPDVTLSSFFFGADPSLWHQQTRFFESMPSDMIILSNGLSGNTQSLIEFLDNTYPDAIKIGATVGTEQPSEAVLYGAGQLHRSGTVVLGLKGNIEMVTALAQGCRPIGSPMFVTRAAGSTILELDGKPALQALDGMFAALAPTDRNAVSHRLVIGLAMISDHEIYQQGDFLIQPLGRIDPQRGAITISGPIAPNQTIQFHLRDPKTSAEDIDDVVSRHLYADACGGLMFTCRERGEPFYGVPNHDSNALAEAVAPHTVAGLFANGEIGAAWGKTFLHAYTTAFALFRPKHVRQTPSPKSRPS